MGRTISLIAVLANLMFATPLALGVTISWAPVGNAGNAAEPQTGHGAVDYNYDIGTYDVTNSQYVAFLNSNDPTGANLLGLYNSNMNDATYGGIDNTGPIGSVYSVIPGNGNHPVNYETWYSAIRFANWLNNGQVAGSTETGSYTLLGDSPIPSNASTITRSPGAQIVLPSLDEWFKAAYYNHATSSYFISSPGSNQIPHAVQPPGTSPSANYFSGQITNVGNLTDIGAYTGTTSPYGAFDMGGNVFQWNEAFAGHLNSDREARGSAFDNDANHLTIYYGVGFDPAGTFADVGFRVAMVPEPSGVVLAAIGFAGLIAWGWRRRQARPT